MAIPTATDIAFAVGVLALLGRSIPASVRVLLLAIAMIDDIAAVLIIALFYSQGLESAGIAIVLLGIGLVWLFQRIGLRSAVVYILPGAVVWFGMLHAFSDADLLAGAKVGVISASAVAAAVALAFGFLFARERRASITPADKAAPTNSFGGSP